MSERSHTTAALADPGVGGFLFRGLLWNVALFGLIRLAWIDRHVVGAIVEFQRGLVGWYSGAPHIGLVVTSDCSGADVMALCAGVLLAYPAAWRRRVTGALVGTAMLLALNILRIATLYGARTRETLDWLHEVAWPIALVAAAAAYMLWWIRRGERESSSVRLLPPMVTPLLLAGGAYIAAVPWVFTSAAMRVGGAWTVTAGARVMHLFGATAYANGDILATTRGAFQVTPECLFTPMLPLWLAVVWSLPMNRIRRWGWSAAALPIFFALGVVRLMALVVPAVLLSRPAILAHGFYQLVAAVVAIIGASHLAQRGEPSVRAASVRVLMALGGALTTALVAGQVWQATLLRAAEAVHRLVPSTPVALLGVQEQQGALLMLPVYQLALVSGLWLSLTGGRRVWSAAGALVALFASQLMFLTGLGVFTSAFDVPLHALVVRGWALMVPLALALLWLGHGATKVGDAGYRRFWFDVGDTFPTLTGASSTDYYFENEKRLIAEALPRMDGISVLKTDLWDEARNTRILQWVAGEGAHAFGVDISEPTVRDARAAFVRDPLRPAVSDVRRLPFLDASFDAIYSMGTIEHFEETEASVHELARVLKPGGRLILGVPNRHDPFLRPAFVWLLSTLGLYDYGFEKSYTRRQLRAMLEDAGLQIRLESGILFIPGWLRMLDLWCYTRVRPLARVTALLVRPFAWLDARVPRLRRHGYLLASVGVKPRIGVGPGQGSEFIVDAHGCDPQRLRSKAELARLFEELLDGLRLNTVEPPLWHVFPGEGGITGMTLLAESHLTIHTYPEVGVATINLYCCRGPVDWEWERQLRVRLGATRVAVRVVARGSDSD